MKKRLTISSIQFTYLRYLVYAAICILILFLFNGTGNEADSINHYLFARYAPNHPELFLNHWAKPFFTLIASPFAQFGFLGIKIFNILCTLAGIIFSEKILSHLKVKYAWLIGLFVFLLPLTYTTTFSGLTEPFGALILVSSIYLILKQRFIFAAVLISFLPFVRSEGLIILGVFGFYFFVNKNYKAIPYLVLGHLIYSLVGWSHYNDFFWVFTKIPYASLNSHYGSGSMTHFAEQFIYVTGLPLLILFVLGLIAILKTHLNQSNWNSPLLVIITGSFLSFFIAHTLFWKFGLFNSMGLKRVLACLIPIIAIISVLGFNFAFDWIKSLKIKKATQIAFIAYSIVFIFTSNPAAINWQKELNLTDAQLLSNEIANWVKNENIKLSLLIYSDPFLSESLEIDPFNPKLHLTLNSPQKLNIQGLIIWDNWHSVVDSDIQLQDLENNPKLIKLKEFDRNGSKFVVFKH